MADDYPGYTWYRVKYDGRDWTRSCFTTSAKRAAKVLRCEISELEVAVDGKWQQAT